MDFNEFNKALNEAVKAVREVRLDQKSDDDLRSMSRVLRRKARLSICTGSTARD